MNTVKEVGVNKNIVLTQAIGEGYLNRRENERNATNRHVMAIAKSVQNAGWFGSIIAVTKNGELLDGQNRLLALRYLGWPSVHVTLRVFEDKDVTPEIRASFNKSRPQSLRDTMTMCFGWGVNATRIVPVFCCLARICNGGDFVTDEYLMLNIEETFPDRLLPFIQGVSSRELSSDMKCAFVLAGLADTERTLELRDNLADMIFTSPKCHARRIFDYLHSDELKSNDSHHTGRRKGHGSSFNHVKRVLFAIDKYIKNEPCPVLSNVDAQKVDKVARQYIELMKCTVSFA